MKHFQTMQIHTLNRASILYSWSSIIFSICFCSFCKNNLTQRSEHNFTTPLTKRNSPMPPFTAAKSSASHRNGGDELVLRHFDPQPYEKKKHITIWDCVQFGILQVRSIGKCFWVQRNLHHAKGSKYLVLATDEHRKKDAPSNDAVYCHILRIFVGHEMSIFAFVRNCRYHNTANFARLLMTGCMCYC